MIKVKAAGGWPCHYLAMTGESEPWAPLAPLTVEQLQGRARVNDNRPPLWALAAEQLRARARECRNMANMAQPADSKDALLELAEGGMGVMS